MYFISWLTTQCQVYGNCLGFSRTHAPMVEDTFYDNTKGGLYITRLLLWGIVNTNDKNSGLALEKRVSISPFECLFSHTAKPLHPDCTFPIESGSTGARLTNRSYKVPSYFRIFPIVVVEGAFELTVSGLTRFHCSLYEAVAFTGMTSNSVTSQNVQCFWGRFSPRSRNSSRFQAESMASRT